MTIRLPVIILCLCLAALACWYVIAHQLVNLTWLTGDLRLVAIAAIFLLPFVILKEMLS